MPCKVIFLLKKIESSEELSVAELLMLLGFVNIEILHKKKLISAKQKNMMFRRFNTVSQRLAFESEQNKAFFAKQTEMIPQTEELRTELTKHINAQDNDSALTTAVKLVDFYCFGVAEGHTYFNLLQKAKADNKEKKYA